MTTIEKYDKCYAEYVKGQKSITKIANENYVSRGRLAKYIKSKGFKIVNKQNELTFNDTVFDIIDTEEKAYWLGFLYADGYVASGNRNVVEVSLKKSDFKHLQKFYSFMESSKSVKTDSFRCRAYLGSKHLKESLVKHGCMPVKSEILTFPSTILDGSLIRHFIRGYFDGDGYFGICKRASGRLFPKIAVLGTWDMLIGILKNIPMDPRTLTYANPGGSTKVFQFSADSFKSILFLDYMYKNCNIYLDRKYEKYKIVTQLPMYAEMYARNGGIKQETPPS